MNNRSQQPRPAEPDMALLYLGSVFETLHHAPERDDAKLDALAAHIVLDERPKTLLGLAITARAEKWIRQRLWMVDFYSLSPSDRAIRIVIDSAVRVMDKNKTQILADAA